MRFWYDDMPNLLQAEIAAMQKYFPGFKLTKLADGRLCWRGKVNPAGSENAPWDLKIIYSHEHPNNIYNNYGGTIDVFPVSPSLSELTRQLGENIPHVYHKGTPDLFICTMRAEDFKSEEQGSKRLVTSTAASCLSAACKWIVVFDLWLNGDVTKQEFQEHTF